MAIKKMMRVRELQECVILWGNCSAMAFIP